MDTTADWINTSTGAPATRKYFDGSGRTLYERDAAGNFTQTNLDLLAQTTSAIRWAGAVGTSGPKVSFLTKYDQKGRVVEEDDDSSGTKFYTYLPTNERVLTQHVPLGAGYGSPLSSYEKAYVGDAGRISLGRVVRKIFTKLVQNVACNGTVEQTDEDIQLNYDSPYAGGSYNYVAGQLSYRTNGNSTVAYGYTVDGQALRRCIALIVLPPAKGRP